MHQLQRFPLSLSAPNHVHHHHHHHHWTGGNQSLKTARFGSEGCFSSLNIFVFAPRGLPMAATPVGIPSSSALLLSPSSDGAHRVLSPIWKVARCERVFPFKRAIQSVWKLPHWYRARGVWLVSVHSVWGVNRDKETGSFGHLWTEIRGPVSKQANMNRGFQFALSELNHICLLGLEREWWDRFLFTLGRSSVVVRRSA